MPNRRIDSGPRRIGDNLVELLGDYRAPTPVAQVKAPVVPPPIGRGSGVSVEAGVHGGGLRLGSGLFFKQWGGGAIATTEK